MDVSSFSGGSAGVLVSVKPDVGGSETVKRAFADMGRAAEDSAAKFRSVNKVYDSATAAFLNAAEKVKRLEAAMSSSGAAASKSAKGMDDVADSAEDVADSMEQAEKSSGGFIDSLRDVGILALGFNAIRESVSFLINELTEMPRLGLAYNKQLENSRIGMAGVVRSAYEVNGAVADWETSLKLSSSLISDLETKSAELGLDFLAVVEATQAIAPAAAKAGVSIDQLASLATAGAAAAKSLGLGANQLVQELRDLVQGGITTASSQLATVLGLRDADIAAAKQSAEGLFSFLMRKMEAFTYAAKEQQNTLEGRMEQLRIITARIAGEAFKPLYDVLKRFYEYLYETTKNSQDTWVKIGEGVASATDAMIEGVKTLLEYKNTILAIGVAYASIKISQFIVGMVEGFRMAWAEMKTEMVATRELAAAKYDLTVKTIQLLEAELLHARAAQASAVGMNAQANAAARVATAQKALSIATGELAVSSGLAARALSAAGGWFGVILTVITTATLAYMTFGDSASTATVKVNRSLEDLYALITKIKAGGYVGSSVLGELRTQLEEELVKLDNLKAKYGAQVSADVLEQRDLVEGLERTISLLEQKNKVIKVTAKDSVQARQVEQEESVKIIQEMQEEITLLQLKGKELAIHKALTRATKAGVNDPMVLLRLREEIGLLYDKKAAIEAANKAEEEAADLKKRNQKAQEEAAENYALERVELERGVRARYEASLILQKYSNEQRRAALAAYDELNALKLSNQEATKKAQTYKELMDGLMEETRALELQRIELTLGNRARFEAELSTKDLTAAMREAAMVVYDANEALRVQNETLEANTAAKLASAEASRELAAAESSPTNPATGMARYASRSSIVYPDTTATDESVREAILEAIEGASSGGGSRGFTDILADLGSTTAKATQIISNIAKNRELEQNYKTYGSLSQPSASAGSSSAFPSRAVNVADRTPSNLSYDFEAPRKRLESELGDQYVLEEELRQEVLREFKKVFAKDRTIGTYVEQLREAQKAFEEMTAQVEAAGVSVSGLNDIFAQTVAYLRNEFSYDIQQQILAFTDPMQAAMNDLGREFITTRADAAELGLSVEAVDTLFRLKVRDTFEQFGMIAEESTESVEDLTGALEEMFGALDDLEYQLWTYNTSLKDQYKTIADNLKLLQAAATAGDNEALLKLPSAINDFMQVSMEFHNELLSVTDDIEGRILSYTNPFAASLKRLRQEFSSTRSAADNVGYSLERVNELFGYQLVEMLTEQFGPAVEDATEVLKDNIRAWESLIGSLSDFRESLMLDTNLSPLTPEERYTEARGQFTSAVERARTGDLEAASELPNYVKRLLDESRSYFASSEEYDRDFAESTSILQEIEDKYKDQLAASKLQLTEAERQAQALEGLVLTAEQIQQLSTSLLTAWGGGTVDVPADLREHFNSLIGTWNTTAEAQSETTATLFDNLTTSLVTASEDSTSSITTALNTDLTYAAELITEAQNRGISLLQSISDSVSPLAGLQQNSLQTEADIIGAIDTLMSGWLTQSGLSTQVLGGSLTDVSASVLTGAGSINSTINALGNAISQAMQNSTGGGGTSSGGSGYSDAMASAIAAAERELADAKSRSYSQYGGYSAMMRNNAVSAAEKKVNSLYQSAQRMASAGYAAGGTPSSGTTATVGEQGPELVASGAASRLSTPESVADSIASNVVSLESYRRTNARTVNLGDSIGILGLRGRETVQFNKPARVLSTQQTAEVFKNLRGRYGVGTGRIPTPIEAGSSSIRKVFSATGGIFRAAGGTVSSSSTYQVGEQGPELAIPLNNNQGTENGSELAQLISEGNRLLQEMREVLRALPAGIAAPLANRLDGLIRIGEEQVEATRQTANANEPKLSTRRLA